MGRLNLLVALISTALLGLWPLAAHGQGINPDRPDLTTSAELVPPGALQIETGIEYERARVGGGPTQQQLSPAGDRQRSAGGGEALREAADRALAIGSQRVDAGALLLLTIGLPWGLSLDVNAGAVALGQRHPEGFIPQGIASGSLSWQVTERLGTITELFFATKEERDSRASLRTTVALLYKLTPLLAVDAGMRSTLVGPGPDWSAFVGLSARFGR